MREKGKREGGGGVGEEGGREGGREGGEEGREGREKKHVNTVV